jgi:hypothetical protein
MNAIRQRESGACAAHCVLEGKPWRDQPELVGAEIPSSEEAFRGAEA